MSSKAGNKTLGCCLRQWQRKVSGRCSVCSQPLAKKVKTPEESWTVKELKEYWELAVVHSNAIAMNSYRGKVDKINAGSSIWIASNCKASFLFHPKTKRQQKTFFFDLRNLVQTPFFSACQAHSCCSNGAKQRPRNIHLNVATRWNSLIAALFHDVKLRP